MVIPFFRRGTPEPEPIAKKTAKGSVSSDPHTSTLDFTHVGDARALADAAGKIHVDEASDADHPAVEEAAILFANGSDDAAAAVLEGALDDGTAGNGETLWNMLFDLYRLTGRKEQFDQRSMVYATIFGRSPPIWSDLGSGVPAVAPRSSTTREGGPSVSLTGTLSAAAAPQFDQIAKIAAKSGKLRIDLAKLRGAEEAGCELLFNLIKGLKQQRIKTQLSNARHLLSMIEGQAVSGTREKQAIWLLVLELLQTLGEQERFDEVALDYAITFEESPPSYEPPDQTATSPNPAPTATAPTLELVPTEEEVEHFLLEGEVSSAQPEPIRKLAKYGSDRSTVEVDAMRLRRMDFVSAGNLFNVLVQFQNQGKLCIIRGVNAMVAALLRVMGIHQVAQIELRRG